MSTKLRSFSVPPTEGQAPWGGSGGGGGRWVWAGGGHGTEAHPQGLRLQAEPVAHQGRSHDGLRARCASTHQHAMEGKAAPDPEVAAACDPFACVQQHI